MRSKRSKRTATAVIAVWLSTGALVTAPAGEARGAAPAAAAVGCPTTVSCGFQCTAKLSTGFCALAVEWQARPKIGGLQVGPGIRISCHVCECWYTYDSSSGSKLFKRTTKMNCSVGSPDIEIHVE